MPLPRSFSCRCGRPIFFGNSICLGCRSPLGYEPHLGLLAPLEPGGAQDSWKLVNNAGTGSYRRCQNLDSPSGCNWLVREDATQRKLCISCRLERVIPDLSNSANIPPYRRFASAKRRHVALLLSLGLQVRPRIDEDPDHGLAFDLLRAPTYGPAILTGHESGIITVNIDEAEDSIREQIRTQMGEPYRTLLGHLRHETGHYYWGRLIQNSQWIDEFRAIFGNEQQDYQAALDAHYQNGAPANWQRNHISAYASAHPWEDWAETWAHLFHMEDTYRTAYSFGLDPASSLELELEPFPEDSLPSSTDAADFLAFLNAWTRLMAVMNELSRAMGQPDFYPFVLSRGVVAKLYFVHRVIEG
jgi:hypothetical protein